MVKLNKLTPEEERVIIDKGTEAPFTGEYDDFWQKGIYVCKQCNSPLYSSDNKFDARCGWPSFDAEIKGAIKRLPTMHRLWEEIQCVKCGAHLGHVFEGEGLTSNNVRYCVNSISMKFVPSKTG